MCSFIANIHCLSICVPLSLQPHFHYLPDHLHLAWSAPSANSPKFSPLEASFLFSGPPARALTRSGYLVGSMKNGLITELSVGIDYAATGSYF